MKTGSYYLIQSTTLVLIWAWILPFNLNGQTDSMNFEVYNARSAKCVINDGDREFTHQFRLSKPPEGNPAVPVLSTFILLPEAWEQNLEIVSRLDTVITSEKGFVDPVYPLVMEESAECNPDPLDYLNEAVYSSSAEYPEKKFDIVSLGKIRAHHLGILYVYPFRYKPDEQNTFQYHMKFTIKIAGNYELLPLNLMSDSDPFIRHVHNMDWFMDSQYITKSTGSEFEQGYEYIIITHSSLRSAADTLLKHRESRGMTTYVKSFDAVITCADIENYIDTCYKNMNPVPKYILLLGDENIIPYSDAIPEKVTDLPYFDIDDEFPWIPDMSYGRIPVRTAGQAMNCVNKIIRYETLPDSSTFFRNAALVSFFKSHTGSSGTECRRYIRTCEEIASLFERRGIDYDRLYLSNENNIQQYTCAPAYRIIEDTDETQVQMPKYIRLPSEDNSDFSWDKGPSSVIESINAGKFLTIHRGHGSINSWGGESIVQLNSDDLVRLTNYEYPAVVWSLNCLTGNFAYTTDCISEQLLKHTGGAVGVVAATDETETIYNDMLAHELTQAVWPEFKAMIHKNPYIGEIPRGEKKMGDILRIALTNLLLSENTIEDYKDPGAVNHMMSYHWLGDPAMDILPRIQCTSIKEINNVFIKNGEFFKTQGSENVEIGTMSIANGGSAKVFASNRILFKKNFSVEKGGYFRANNSQECYEDNLYDIPVKNISDENFPMQPGIITSEQLNDSYSAVNIYPNPSKGIINIELPIDEYGAQIQIYNSSGLQVYNEHTFNVLNRANLSKHPKGLYIIKITLESKNLIRKCLLD